MSDQQNVPHLKPRAADTLPDRIGRAGAAPPAIEPSDDTRLAVDIRNLVEQGDMETARDRFAELVSTHQRRALRIAFHYLRDASDADEAVQDAFVKVFTHITSYREAWPFEVWFTRVLINGCLDRRKARARRERWVVHHGDDLPESAIGIGGKTEPDPEARLLADERRQRVAAAIDRLDGRQRTVFMLCHYGDCSPRDVSAMTGISESTVRVHLFRAARKLRRLLGGQP